MDKEPLSYLDILFYHIYKSLVKSDGKKYSRLLSYFIVSGLLCFNILALFIFLNMLGFRSLYVWFSYSSELKSGLIYVIVAFILSRLYAEPKYMQIIKDVSKRPLKHREKGAKITILYGLVSVVLVFVLAVVNG